MDKNLKGLKPALVWKHFAEICNIPHPSHEEDAIRAYIVKWAEELGLEHKVDEAQNVYVYKPATPGMEDRKGIILQAHTDMVPQKNNDKEFNFSTDPIEAYIDGEWVTANGTTLGADNGIGIVEFDKRDIVRHQLVKYIVEAFDKREAIENGLKTNNDNK